MPNLLAFMRKKYALILILLILSPYFILGPYSIIRTHDNLDSVMIWMMYAAQFFPDTPNWYPHMASGVGLRAQGASLGPLNVVFKLVPPWLGYFFLLTVQVGLGLYGFFKICTDKFKLEPVPTVLVACILFYHYEATMLVSAPVFLSFFFTWIFLNHFDKETSTVTQAAAALALGAVTGYLNGLYYLISFWIFFPALIILLHKGITLRACINAILFVSGSFALLYTELQAAFLAAPLSHRNFELREFYDPLSYLTFPIILLSGGIIGSLFIKPKPAWLKRALTFFSLLCIIFIGLPAVKDHLLSHLNFLEGFSFGRIFKIIAILGALIVAFYISSIISLQKKTHARIATILVLIIPLSYYYINNIHTNIYWWIMSGNNENFSLPQLEALAKQSKETKHPFRVDMVNFPTGSALLSSYDLSAIGGYLTLYPNRYKSLFADILSPPSMQEASSSAKNFKEWGNRLNLSCDKIENGHLQLDECINLDLIGLLNVRFLISKNPMKHADLVPLDVEHEPWNLLSTKQKIIKSVKRNFGGPETLFIYELKNYAPRFFLAKSFQIVDDQETLSRLRQKSSLEELKAQPLFLRQDIASLPETHKLLSSHGRGMSNNDGKIGELQISPDKIRVTVEAPETSILVIGNSYDPSWKATINDKNTALLPAYGALWGLPVKQGKNVIELVYKPN